MKKCINCKKDTRNPKFCSRSCSAIYNNRIKPKGNRTKLTNPCRKCGKLIWKRNRWCEDCHKSYREGISQTTLRDVLITKGHPSWAHAKVRARAQTVARQNKWDRCICCGYDKVFEICHIQPISTFDLDTKLSTINSIKNLVPLCPNCHWEFDHKFMSEENKKKIFEFTSLEQESPLNSN